MISLNSFQQVRCFYLLCQFRYCINSGAGTAHEQCINFATNHANGTAEAVYNLINAPNAASFSVQARHKGSKHISIQYHDALSSVNNPVGSQIDLGFQQDGAVSFILSGSGPLFTSSNPPTGWMQSSFSSIGSKSLREIAMPASHDSGMNKLTHHYTGVKHNTLTQSHGVYAQAENGARYFDIRPVIRKGEFYVGHFSRVARPLWVLVGPDVGGTGSLIQDIVHDINRFNDDFPGELVILDISHDMDIDNGFRHFNMDEWYELYSILDGIVDLWIPQTSGPLDLSTVPLSTFIKPGSRSATIIRLPFYAPVPSPRRKYSSKKVETGRHGNGNGKGNGKENGNGKAIGNGEENGKVAMSKRSPSKHKKGGFTLHKVPTIVHTGAFVSDMWMPVVNQYSDTTKPDRMSTDQISKMLEHDPAENGALMSVWTLTQNWQQGMDIANHKHSIIGAAVQAHRRLFRDLWPAMSKRSHPNLVQVDDIYSKDVLALTMAINDNFVSHGHRQLSRRGVPIAAPEPTPCSTFDRVAHWFNLYPESSCFNPHPFQSFAKNAQELAAEWERDKLANEHARVNDTAAIEKDEEAWTSRKLASMMKTMTITPSEARTTSHAVSRTKTPESMVTYLPVAEDELDEESDAWFAYYTPQRMSNE